MEYIFIKLLNMSISAGWLVVALILLRPLLKKAPKYISCILWGLVGLRLCLPISLESVLSLIPSTQTVPPEILYARQPQLDTGIDFINSSVNPILSQSMAPAPLTSVNPMQIVMILGANLWILGMVVMALYALISYLLLRFKLREAVRQSENIWVCDRVDSPFLLGIFRPRIYLPSSLSEETAAYVIAHEKAHLKRKDHWWKPLGFLILTVYWFNPLMWVAYILLCRDIEYACDEKVLRFMGMDSKKAYSEALVSCSAPRKMISACPVAFGEDGVKGRIKSVLNYKKPAFWIIVIAIAVSIAVALCFLTDPAEDSGTQDDLFGGVFETGQCQYSFVVSEDKETQSNELIFRIDPEGQVYKDYGGGENEYLGTLQPSDLTLEELNDWLFRQGESSIYFEDLSTCWELLDADGGRMHIFYLNSPGHAGVISFFSDGRIMNWFTLDRIGDFSSVDLPLVYQFNATVLNVHEGELLVEPFADEDEAKTADRFYVTIPTSATDTFAIGEYVQIVYDGMIQELYPARLPHVTAITKLPSEDTLSNAPIVYQNTATFDIDSDGINENCYLTLGPEYGSLLAYENGILEYNFPLLDDSSFHTLSDGKIVMIVTVENGLHQQCDISIEDGELVLTRPSGLIYSKSSPTVNVTTLSSLREKYPQFFELSTDKGLEVYVWNNGEYRCGVRAGTDREATTEELWVFRDGTTLEEMAVILQYYGVSRENVAVLYSYHPAFSGPYPDVPKDQRAIEETLFSDPTRAEPIVVIPEPSAVASHGFDINTQYKLIIYAYQMGENAWRFQFVKNSRLGHTALSLMQIDSMSLETARQLLKSYDLAPEDIPVIVYNNPYSSYLHDIGTTAIDTARKLLFLAE